MRKETEELVKALDMEAVRFDVEGLDADHLAILKAAKEGLACSLDDAFMSLPICFAISRAVVRTKDGPLQRKHELLRKVELQAPAWGGKGYSIGYAAEKWYPADKQEKLGKEFYKMIQEFRHHLMAVWIADLEKHLEKHNE